MQVPDYNGFSITIDPKSFTFTGKFDTEVFRADSLAKLHERIDIYAKQQAAMEREKTTIEAMDATGTPYIITGIHARNGHITTKPRRESYASSQLYANVSEARAIQAKVASAQSELDTLKKELSRFSIAPKFPYGGDNNHAERVAILKAVAELAAKGLTGEQKPLKVD